MEVFSAIGATLDLRAGSTMVRPNTPIVEKLRVVVSGWKVGEIARWEVADVERLAGLVSSIVAFLGSRKARQTRWSMMGQLAAQPQFLLGSDSCGRKFGKS